MCATSKETRAERQFVRVTTAHPGQRGALLQDAEIAIAPLRVRGCGSKASRTPLAPSRFHTRSARRTEGGKEETQGSEEAHTQLDAGLESNALKGSPLADLRLGRGALRHELWR